MFAIARGVANRTPRTSLSRISARSFAEVIPTPTNSSSSSPLKYKPRKLHRILKEKVPVREDHGLYGFFRKKENADELTGEAKYEIAEEPASKQKQTGRSWRASELRLKSFGDLHTLWYILLRERNLLATQKEEVRRMGVSDTFTQVSTTRVYHVRKSMARIKAVLNERRLAYEGAIKLVEAERDEKIDQEVQNSLEGAWHRKVQHMKRRQAYLVKRREMQLAKQSKVKRPADTPEVSAATPTANTTPKATPETPTATATSTTPKPPVVPDAIQTSDASTPEATRTPGPSATEAPAEVVIPEPPHPATPPPRRVSGLRIDN